MVDAETGTGSMHLELRGISRRFGDVQAVDDVSLSVGYGDIVCLVGRSDCGKSSLLRIVAGIDFPDRGQVFLAGEDFYDNPQSAYAAEFFCTFNKVPVTCRDGTTETPFGRPTPASVADGIR